MKLFRGKTSLRCLMLILGLTMVAAAPGCCRRVPAGGDVTHPAGDEGDLPDPSGAIVWVMKGELHVTFLADGETSCIARPGIPWYATWWTVRPEPGGTRVLYGCWDDESGFYTDLWLSDVADPAKPAVRVFSPPPGERGGEFCWSADGSGILATSTEVLDADSHPSLRTQPNLSSIWVVDVQTPLEPRRITRRHDFLIPLGWDPASQTAYLVVGGEGGFIGDYLVVTPVSVTAARPWPDADARGLTLSPDARYLAVSRARPPGLRQTTEVSILRASQPAGKPLATFEAWLISPLRWSPSGDAVAFLAEQVSGEGSFLWVLALDGTARELGACEGDLVGWSPDGGYLLVNTGRCGASGYLHLILPVRPGTAAAIEFTLPCGALGWVSGS